LHSLFGLCFYALGIAWTLTQVVIASDQVFPIESEIDGYLAVKRLVSQGGGDIVDLSPDQQEKARAILSDPEVKTLQRKIRVAKDAGNDGVLLSPDFPAFDRAIANRLHRVLTKEQLVALHLLVITELIPTPESLLYVENRWALCGGTEEERQKAIVALVSEAENANAVYREARDLQLQGLFKDLSNDQKAIVCEYFGNAISAGAVSNSLRMLDSHDFTKFVFWMRGNPKRFGDVQTSERLALLQDEQGKRTWGLVKKLNRQPTPAELKAINAKYMPDELKSILGGKYAILLHEYQLDRLANETTEIIGAKDFQQSISLKNDQMEKLSADAKDVEKNLKELQTRRNAKIWQAVLRCSNPVKERLTPVLSPILVER
jgi:hypothetical protein